MPAPANSGQPQSPQSPLPVLQRPQLRNELPGLLLLLLALLFTAWFALPELRINLLPINDFVYHITASERLATALQNREPFLNPWVSEFSLGYPIWLSYQPIPHTVAALAFLLVPGDHAATFSLLAYLLLVTLPASIYLGARLLGLAPLAAGLASILVYAPSATGYPGSFGIGYGAYTWRGSGLFTQLFALHLLALSLGLIVRALDNGAIPRRLLAAALLAITSLSHIVFGYAAFLSAFLFAVTGPPLRRSQRLVRLLSLAIPALLTMAWFLVPLFLSRQVVNHSRWEAPVKWNSFGAPWILREIATGQFFDHGRAPLLTLLLALGITGAILLRAETLARRLLALTAVWLLLFFGRETWGHLMFLAAAPADLHLHRLQVVFELAVILLASLGLIHLIQLAGRRHRLLGLAAALAVELAVLGIAIDRAAYLKQNQIWGDQNLAAHAAERPDLNAALADVKAILAARPGRLFAGHAATWGRQFRSGSVPVYEFANRNHIPQASYLNHSMSKPSDIMSRRGEQSLQHDAIFGVRAVLAPAGQAVSPHLRPRSVHGRFAVYEASPEGFFGVVDVVAHFTGADPFPSRLEESWLASPFADNNLVISTDPRAPLGPAIASPAGPLPQPVFPSVPLRARVVAETKDGETYRATIESNRPAHAYVKMSWDPHLAATVDGNPAPLYRVTPGFGAVPIPAGLHNVEVSYRPGPLRPILLFLGIAAFLACHSLLRHPRFAPWESAAIARLAVLGHRFATPRAAATAAILLAALPALHPLFRGILVSGHDSSAYIPLLVEMTRSVQDRVLPAFWAPDLGAGHGEPIWVFVPHLLSTLAQPFLLVFRLADSLQFAVALQFLAGAAGVYRLARHFSIPRYAAAGAAIAWLYAPYVSFDLYVRGAFHEACAIAWTPVALWALCKAVGKPSLRNIALAAFAVALVQLSHPGAALLLMPTLALVTAAAAWSVARLRLTSRHWQAGVLAIALGLALSAWFWVPAMVETRHLDTARFIGQQFTWNYNILSPVQVLWSRWGYGLSVPGSDDALSFDPGPAHLLLAALGAAVLWRRGTAYRAYALAWIAIAIAGAFLATTLSAPLWARIPTLQLLQFPWRALMLPAIALPILAAFALQHLGRRLALAAVALLVAINLIHTEPKGYFDFNDDAFSPANIASQGIRTGTPPEAYEPKWVPRILPPYPAPILSAGPALSVVTLARQTALQSFLVTSRAPNRVESELFYYPGWAVTIDGAPVPVSPVPGRGTMQFDVPAGTHTITMRLYRDEVQKASIAVSLATLLFLGGVLVLERRNRRAA